MNTLEILEAFKIVTKCTRSAQFNVIPCDHLSQVQVKTYPFLLCVNLDESFKRGTHWVGLYIARKGAELEFFDSFGRSVNSMPKYFIKFVIKNNLKVLERQVQLQGPKTQVCGQYVILYMFMRVRGCSMNDFYAKFVNNYDTNDKLVKRFVDKLFIKTLSCKNTQTCTSRE